MLPAAWVARGPGGKSKYVRCASAVLVAVSAGVDGVSPGAGEGVALDRTEGAELLIGLSPAFQPIAVVQTSPCWPFHESAPPHLLKRPSTVARAAVVGLSPVLRS